MCQTYTRSWVISGEGKDKILALTDLQRREAKGHKQV